MSVEYDLRCHEDKEAQQTAKDEADFQNAKFELQEFMKVGDEGITNDFVQDYWQQMDEEDFTSIALHVAAREYEQIGRVVTRFLAQQKWDELMDKYELEGYEFDERWVL